jgi:CPA2 family monovalent cation:H+ antiporter-2
MVLALVLIPAFAAALSGGTEGTASLESDAFVALTEQLLNTHLVLWQVLILTGIKLLAFAGFMIVVGRRIIPAILHATAHSGNRELFRLAVLAIALGVAAGSAYLFGVSLALGAFFAGMILSESQLSQRAAQETLPLRDAFGVLFFVSVGMLVDPGIVTRAPLAVVATLLIIIFGKSLVGFGLLVLLRRPVGSALTVSASLAQIGEFSFILAALGIGLGILPEEGRDLILAGSIISIVLNPLVFWAAERARPRIEARVARRIEPELGPVVPDHADEVAPPAPEPEEVLEEAPRPTSLSNHVVLIGYGRVGSVVAAELQREQTPFLLIEDAEDRVLAARELGIEVIVGNAAGGEALRLANVMGARCVVIGIPNAFEAGQATEQCRKLNPEVKIIARAHSEEEVDYLARLGADEVIMGEREIGLGMIDWLRGEERTTMKREGAGLRFADAENILESVRDSATTGAATVEPVPEAAPSPEPAEAAPGAEAAAEVEAGAPSETAAAGPATLSEAPESEVTAEAPAPDANAADSRVQETEEAAPTAEVEESAPEVAEPAPNAAQPDAKAARVVPASAITLLLPGGEEVPPDSDATPDSPAAANSDAPTSEAPSASNDEAPSESPDSARDEREKVESGS